MEETLEEFLKNYDSSQYEKPSVTVDILLFTVLNGEKENYRKLPEKGLRLLLINRLHHPYKGSWAIPGGFVDMEENLEDAAMRELKEETNIDNIYLEQLYTFGDVGRDPRARVISCAYMSLVDSSGFNVIASDDARDAKWFTVSCRLQEEQKTMTEEGYIKNKYYKLKLESDSESLDALIKVTINAKGNHVSIKREIAENNGLAFDHALAIFYGIERLRNKIEYTGIAFNLMPELFTLTELQQVYEVILGRELLKANFRRKIADMVIETNEYTKDAGHRPSKLYRKNPNWTEFSQDAVK